MKLSGLTLCGILWGLSMSAPFAFAQSYSAGGGSTPGLSFNNATAVCGGRCTAFGPLSSAYGSGSTASGTGSSAYGIGSTASSFVSSAYGSDSTASGLGSNAYGCLSRATGTSSIAYGSFSTASGDTSVALGDTANASARDSVALGSRSVANDPNTVSVGAPGSERRITNVAPGINPTDAVNMSQFSGLANDVRALRSDIGKVASSRLPRHCRSCRPHIWNSCDSRENVD